MWLWRRHQIVLLPRKQLRRANPGSLNLMSCCAGHSLIWMWAVWLIGWWVIPVHMLAVGVHVTQQEGRRDTAEYYHHAGWPFSNQNKNQHPHYWLQAAASIRNEASKLCLNTFNVHPPIKKKQSLPFITVLPMDIFIQFIFCLFIWKFQCKCAREKL